MKQRWLFSIAGVAAAIAWASTGQTVMNKDNSIQVLGSVQVDQTTVKILIAYSADAAILELALPGAAGETYAPLFASTYRGIPSVNLDVYVSGAGDQIWVQSSWPDAPVLAYHLLGSDSAITSFGETALLETAFPETLSGGAVAFPVPDPQSVRKLASFYHAETP